MRKKIRIYLTLALLFGVLLGKPSSIFMTTIPDESTLERNTHPIPVLAVQNPLALSLMERENNSLITNGTELLFRFTGTDDHLLYYRWSVEANNYSLFVNDEYFILTPPSLPPTEQVLGLYLYASENSSQEGRPWIYLYYEFMYDFLAPQYTLSHPNTSRIESFTQLNLNISEPSQNSSYRWDKGVSQELPNNHSSFVLEVDFPQGTHILTLHLEDEVGNVNTSTHVYNVTFAIQSIPVNNSAVKAGSFIELLFSDPYPALFAWDNHTASGILDPVPSEEGLHQLVVLIEKTPGIYSEINLLFLVDNTPITIAKQSMGAIIVRPLLIMILGVNGLN